MNLSVKFVGAVSHHAIIPKVIWRLIQPARPWLKNQRDDWKLKTNDSGILQLPAHPRYITYVVLSILFKCAQARAVKESAAMATPSSPGHATNSTARNTPQLCPGGPFCPRGKGTGPLPCWDCCQQGTHLPLT